MEEPGTSLPLLVVELGRGSIDQIEALSKKIAEFEKATAREAARATTTRRLLTMPGVGPITAMAIETFAPPMEVFKRGRDFAAWLGLVPRSIHRRQTASRENIEDGPARHPAAIDYRGHGGWRWAIRKGKTGATWLHRMLARKPRMLVAIALANKMARSIWAMLTKAEDHRVPVVATP